MSPEQVGVLWNAMGLGWGGEGEGRASSGGSAARRGLSGESERRGETEGAQPCRIASPVKAAMAGLMCFVSCRRRRRSKGVRSAELVPYSYQSEVSAQLCEGQVA